MMVASGSLKALGVAGAFALVLSMALTASAQDAAKKQPSAAKTATACKGLSESACKTHGSTCAWISPKTGKQKPYCRLKSVKSKK